MSQANRNSKSIEPTREEIWAEQQAHFADIARKLLSAGPIASTEILISIMSVAYLRGQQQAFELSRRIMLTSIQPDQKKAVEVGKMPHIIDITAQD